MEFSKRPKLCAQERELDVARYYDIEPPELGVLERQLLENGCPIDPQNAIPAETFTDFVARIETYSPCEFGYCMLDDKRGYMANYLIWRNVKPGMPRWWYSWINVNHQSVGKEEGCLHYKVWYPGEHFDHGFINGKDKTDGIYALDYDQEGNLVRTERFALDITAFGITPERATQLRESGYLIDCAWETGEGGMHLSLNVTRNHANGIIEKRTRTWIGYGIRDGKVVKDEQACCTDAMLHSMLYHQAVEGSYLDKLMPELYERYSKLPAEEV